MRVSTAAVAAIACGLLILAGCGKESPEPKPLETASTSTTPSATVSPAPSMPPAAGKRTKAGAIAFVRHFVELTNRALESGDFAKWDQLVSDDCQSCAEFRSAVTDIYADGGSVHGGVLSPTQVVLAPGGLRPDGATIDLVATLNAQQIRRPGRPVTKGQPDKTFITYLLEFDPATGWIVQSYTRDA